MMKPRPDLVHERAPGGVEVFQLTDERGVPWSHVYMEAQIFAPDSRRFLLHRSATAHGSDKDDPEHRYYVCDLADGGALSPLTHERGATAPSVSPNGRFVYYFVNETEPGGGRLTLMRVGMDGSDRRTVMTIDAPLPSTRFRPSRIYPLSTISSDGRRLALSAFLGDGRTESAPFGLMVFDLERASVALVLSGCSWCNMHPQYSRSPDPGEARDILIQENHGSTYDATGKVGVLVGEPGADIHVVRDDGTDFRDMPWGRDGREHCQGHQCWRGRSRWAVTSTGIYTPGDAETAECGLVEGLPAVHAGHVGSRTPGGLRNVLSRSVEKPRFWHFATDAAGERFIVDWRHGEENAVLTARFGASGRDPLSDWAWCVSPRAVRRKESHIHPFLSPDGAAGFFNSDESGALNAYMVRGCFAGG